MFKRGGFKSKAYKKRFAVYEPRTNWWYYYESKEHANAHTKVKGQVKVVQAAAVKKSARANMERRTSLTATTPTAADDDGKREFRFNRRRGASSSARRERRGAKAVARRAPVLADHLVQGYLHKRKQGAKSKTFDRRYAVFDPQTNVFSYYSNERDARMDKDIKGA